MRRWEYIEEAIVERFSDKTFWRTTYNVGATENQDSDYFYDDAVFEQVKKKITIGYVWEEVE